MIEKGYAENMKIKKYGLDSSGKGSSILPLKQTNKQTNMKIKRGSRLGVACKIAQPIQLNLGIWKWAI